VVAGSGEPSFPFARSRHDRLAHRRDDETWLAERGVDPEVLALVVADGTVAMDGDDLRLVPVGRAPAGERALLGTVDGRTYLAVMVEEIAADLEPQPLRAAGSRLDAAQASLLVHAAGLANWHRTHPRCSRCGEPTVVALAGHVRSCPACQALHFPRTDPAVIMLVTDARDRALLGRQASWPARRFSALAGFVEPGEALEDAVRREVAEEVGLVVTDVGYLGSQPWPFPSSLMVGFFATAQGDDIRIDGHEIAEARWFTRDELRDLTADGSVLLPGAMSISRWLIETWNAGPLPGDR